MNDIEQFEYDLYLRKEYVDYNGRCQYQYNFALILTFMLKCFI
ncbi:hypothetical protein VIM7927_04387 [Vibrio mangrovi]|uniref:Uncharacterized protein n=1 Tax=Vibrio mangrovi TaxID=474394 RepID=A0A1Y6IZD3_9VIBR|nr:hypothetical protein VIM7927_04387 [Vibrio mangrovi]